MTQLTFETLATTNLARCEQVFHGIDDWSPNDWATSLAGEVGELCNKLKKRRRGETIADAEIAEELADVVLYLDLLATRIGINLESAVRNKFNAVSDRKGSDIRL
jgi:NTP pyrophosphatase (non-canonical NTP hydrolase)